MQHPQQRLGKLSTCICTYTFKHPPCSSSFVHHTTMPASMHKHNHTSHSNTNHHNNTDNTNTQRETHTIQIKRKHNTTHPYATSCAHTRSTGMFRHTQNIVHPSIRKTQTSNGEGGGIRSQPSPPVGGGRIRECGGCREGARAGEERGGTHEWAIDGLDDKYQRVFHAITCVRAQTHTRMHTHTSTHAQEHRCIVGPTKCASSSSLRVDSPCASSSSMAGTPRLTAARRRATRARRVRFHSWMTATAAMSAHPKTGWHVHDVDGSSFPPHCVPAQKQNDR